MFDRSDGVTAKQAHGSIANVDMSPHDGIALLQLALLSSSPLLRPLLTTLQVAAAAAVLLACAVGEGSTP